MKKFGFMLMAAAVAVMTITSCGKKNDPDDPIIPPTPSGGDELTPPAMDGTAGAVTLVIHFDQAPCAGYDVLFVGDYEGTSWKFDSAKKFEAVKDGWYKVVLKPNADGNISGRPIQTQNAQEEWSWDWSHDGNDLVKVKNATDDMIKDSGYGEINLSFTKAHADDAVVVYLQSKKWNVYPCAAAAKYEITLKAPAFCGEEYDVEVVGSFEGWGKAGVKMAKNGNVYTATIDAKEGDEIKFRGIVADDPATTDADESWSVQIHGLNKDPESEHFDEYMEMGNQKLGAELKPVYDWSDPATYSWNICLP
jgi:hypothetical protein